MTALMPELPEVETVRRSLDPRLRGRSIIQCQILDPRWCAPEAAQVVERALSNKLIKALRRRGKYLLLQFETGESLAMHLRMTGTLLYGPAPATPHVRVTFELDDGNRVSFADPRRFGTGEFFSSSGSLEHFLNARLGPEPFDPGFTAEHMGSWLYGRRAAIKPLLLDQRLVAGIGNIYADESLFRSRINPNTPGGRLTLPSRERLRQGIIDSLLAGIEAGGATIDDFRDPDGVWGGYQSEFLVHRREGEDCPNCARPIRKGRLGGRATYWCSRCQPLRANR